MGAGQWFALIYGCFALLVVTALLIWRFARRRWKPRTIMETKELYGGPLDGEQVRTIRCGEGGKLCLSRLSTGQELRYITYIYVQDESGKFRYERTCR